MKDKGVANYIETLLRSPGLQSFKFWADDKSDDRQTVRYIVHWRHGFCGAIIVRYLKNRTFEGLIKLTFEKNLDGELGSVIEDFRTGIQNELKGDVAEKVYVFWKNYYEQGLQGKLQTGIDKLALHSEGQTKGEVT